METKRVTISFDVFTGLDAPLTTDEEWTSALGRVLDSWSDGRYPFHVEMIHQGLESVLLSALEKAVEETCRKRIGEGTNLQGIRRYIKVAKMKMAKVKFLRLYGGGIETAQVGQAQAWERA